MTDPTTTMAARKIIQPGTCRTCGAAVYWLINDRTRKRAPIDAKPSPTGNVTVDLADGTYRVLSGNALIQAQRTG